MARYTDEVINETVKKYHQMETKFAENRGIGLATLRSWINKGDTALNKKRSMNTRNAHSLRANRTTTKRGYAA